MGLMHAITRTFPLLFYMYVTTVPSEYNGSLWNSQNAIDDANTI